MNIAENNRPAEGLAADCRPDFRHVKSWIFDLDNTLYCADNGIFAQIETRMTDYVMAFLKLPREAAYARQKHLYRQYGTTLNGLMREHGAAADDYLHYVHDIDLSSLAPDTALTAAIEKLPGQRFVFTNGCRDHAARILDRLGIAALFDAVWDIRTMEFMPKPQVEAYQSVVAASGINCREAAMFDDIACNLVPARAMGMTTIWLKNDALWGKQGPLMEVAAGDIDHQTDNLTQFLHSIRI
ncbi:MAG TPA: pyrimidine 5'-nucleotidase [Rhizomicrobium sp.]|nr:pyrimidine 5'-nucleotidase [Rhizomicrobium sp.]